MIPYLTRDVMRLTVCHETGHFFAGFPFSRAGNARPTPDVANLGTFLASEAQSDDFATKSCLWRVWAGDPDNAAYRDLVPTKGRARCDAAWGDDQDRRDMCYRTIVVAREWVRWKNDASRRQCSMGCVPFEEPEIEDESYVCAEDFPPDKDD